MKRISGMAILTLALLAVIPATSFAQQLPPLSPYPPSDNPPSDYPPPPDDEQQFDTSEQPSQQPAYSQQQIDQLTASIALYPDALVSQILMASTYPLEVVEADRWRNDPQNAQLNGEQLAAALEPLPWDPSVKSLVAFPHILDMMDKHLQWTEQLGDAFLAQEADVMDSIQRLRAMAQQAGNLNSNQQQVVSGPPGAIVIEPAVPETVYVPVYNPTVIYGAWPWPDYQPYYYPFPSSYVYTRVGYISYTPAIIVVDRLWGWSRWDWRRHRIHIDDRRFVVLNRGRPSHYSGEWHYNPEHRHGVPFANPVVRARFDSNANDANHRRYRGYDNDNHDWHRDRDRQQNQNPAVQPADVRSTPVTPQATTDGSYQRWNGRRYYRNERNTSNPVESRTSNSNETPSNQVPGNNLAPPVHTQPQEQSQQKERHDWRGNRDHSEHREQRQLTRFQPMTAAPQQAAPQQQPQRAAPVFDSFRNNRNEVREQSERGRHSRSSQPAVERHEAQPRPAPQPAAAPAQPAPQQQKQDGGNQHHGGGEHHDRGDHGGRDRGGDRGDHGDRNDDHGRGH